MSKYFTIESQSEGLYKDRGSKFLSFLFEVNDEKEIKRNIQIIKELHPKATHACYAYRLGQDGENWKAADAGEPSGSAGLPILNQLRSASLTNILCVVVRYYGGSKLGLPGLINAYKEATIEGIRCSTVIEKEVTRSMIIEVEFHKLSEVISILKINKLDSFEINHLQTVTQLTFLVKPEEETEILNELQRHIKNHILL